MDRGYAQASMSRRSLLAGAGAGLAWPMLARAEVADDPWWLAAAIVARVQAPRFPARDFPVTRYGARGDGRTRADEAIRKAIAACVAAGGGRVTVPAGDYATGPIRLRSNVNLHLEEGARLLFSTDPKDYPLVHTRWEGMELLNYCAAPLRLSRAQHRDHRQRHDRRPGRPQPLVELEGRMARHDRPWLARGPGRPAAGARAAAGDGRARHARSSSACSATAPICARP